MSGHKPLNASSTKWFWYCPGAWAWLQIFPVEDKPSKDAGLGTAAHYLLETCLSTGNHPGYIGYLIAVTSEDAFFVDTDEEYEYVFEVDQDMAEAVDCAVKYVEDRLKEHGLGRGSLRIEKRVNPLPDNNDTGGTADIIIDGWPKFIEVVDYKHGQGVFVPVKSNQQLQSYALGAYHLLHGDICGYEEIKYTIVQPRHLQAPPDGVMSETISVEELKAWGVELEKAVDRAYEALRLVKDEGLDIYDLHKRGYISAGEDGAHCKFCPLKATCPERTELAQRTAMVEFSDEPDSIPVPTEADQLSRAAKWIPLIRDWADAVMKSVHERLMSGEEIEGQKLVRGRSFRKWKGNLAEQDIVELMLKNYGLRDLFIQQDPKLITGPQAEKLISKDQRKEFNALMLEKTQGKITVAPESDRRKAVDVDPAKDFED